LLFKSVKVKIFLTVFLVYLFYIAPNYIAANTYRYVMLARAVADDGTFNIDKEADNTRDRSSYGEHYYIGAAPGLGLTAVPLYMVLKPVIGAMPGVVYRDHGTSVLNLFFTFFFSLLPGALIAVLLYEVLQQFELDDNDRILIVLASAFGTILFYYSTKFTAHTMGAFLLFSAFHIFFISRYRPVPPRSYFIAGLCLGSAVLFEYTLAIASGLLAIYSMINIRKVKLSHYLLLGSGISLMALAFMSYHYACFENPFALATTYSRMVGPIPFAFPQPKIIFELTFGTYRGIFMYMPVLLAGAYGLFVFYRKPIKEYIPEVILISLICPAIFMAVALFCNKVWPWGGDFGPRFFICFVPFLMIPAAFARKALGYRILFWISAVSIFINWCGVQYGDADSVFTDIGLFIFMGLNSNLAEWAYGITNGCIRKLNVITHFSPLLLFVALLAVIYIIWKDEIDGRIRFHFCKKTGMVT